MNPTALARLLIPERKEVLIACVMLYLCDIAETLHPSERVRDEPQSRIDLNVAWALGYRATQLLDEAQEVEGNEVQFYEFAQLLLQELVERCAPG